MEINTRPYSLSIERRPDGYLAYFPALEGCNTWGKTYEQAVRHAEEALALYLETFDEIDPGRARSQATSLARRDSANSCHRLICSLDFRERVQGD